MRLFISIAVSPEVIALATTIHDSIRQQEIIEASFVPGPNLHCTLAFLGDIPEEQVPTIASSLQAIHMPRFTVSLEDLQVDSNNNPHILWFTLASSSLSILADKIKQQLNYLNIDKRFKAHITLARIKKVLNAQKLKLFINTFYFDTISWQVTEYTLKQSILTPQGALHETLYVLPLQS